MDRNDRQVTASHGLREYAVDGDALRQSSALLDLSFEPIFAWDLAGGITEWNIGAEMLYGFSKSEAIGRPSHDLLRSVFSIPLQTFLNDLETAGSWSGEIRHFAKDGREILVESRQQVIGSGGRQFVIEINRPITQRRA